MAVLLSLQGLSSSLVDWVKPETSLSIDDDRPRVFMCGGVPMLWLVWSGWKGEWLNCVGGKTGGTDGAMVAAAADGHMDGGGYWVAAAVAVADAHGEGV